MKKAIQFAIMSVVTIGLTVVAASSEPVGDWFLAGSDYFFGAVLVSALILLGILWTNEQAWWLNLLASLLLLAVLLIVQWFQLPFWGPSITLTRDLEGATLYIVEATCFPPDSAFECDEGATHVYLRDQFSLVARKKLSMKFGVESVKQEGQVLKFMSLYGQKSATLEF